MESGKIKVFGFILKSRLELYQVAIVTGPSRKLLLGERPALNMLARASGVASRAKSLHDIKVREKWNGVIAATRKTTPGTKRLINGSQPQNRI